MNLAIFDIDGTLTKTDQVDEICFVQALSDAHGINDISTDWASYPHTTDSAITSHIYQQRFNREPEETELQKFKHHFVSLLKNHCHKNPILFSEIPGAASMIRRLNQEPDWRVAIATGSWSVAASLKLKLAGIDNDDFPIAFADDGFSREDILQSAIGKAEHRYQQSNFKRIVSVGDGVWDVRTACNLEFPFLGVGSGERRERLRTAGATHVITDFSDYAEVLRSLDDVAVPQFK